MDTFDADYPFEDGKSFVDHIRSMINKDNPPEVRKIEDMIARCGYVAPQANTQGRAGQRQRT